MPNISHYTIFNLFAYLEENNIDVKSLCASCHMDYVEFRRQATTSREEEKECLWRNSLKLVENQELGFELGLTTNTAALGLFGMIIQNSSTVGQALQHTASFVPLVSKIVNYKVLLKGHQFEVVTTHVEGANILYPNRSKQLALMALALTIRFYSILTLNKVITDKIVLPRHVKDTTIFKQYAHAITHSEKDEYKIIASTKYLNHKIINADNDTLNLLIEKAYDTLESSKENLAERVEKILVTQYFRDFQSVEQVATQLNMSARTLQRKLGKEDTSFTIILDKIRYGFASASLQRNGTVKETALSLGYSDTTSFSKAFKKWSGQSPKQFVMMKRNGN